MKKVGDKITFNHGGLKGTKEYTIKKVVVQEDTNRFKYWISKTQFIVLPIEETKKGGGGRFKHFNTHSGIIGF